MRVKHPINDKDVSSLPIWEMWVRPDGQPRRGDPNVALVSYASLKSRYVLPIDNIHLRNNRLAQQSSFYFTPSNSYVLPANTDKQLVELM